MRGKIVSRDEASVQLQLPIAEILAGIPDTVESLAAEAGLLVMKALIDEEVERRVGPRYAHAADRTGVRWGREDGHVVFAGRKVAFQRQRVRDRDGHEVELDRYRLFQANGRMQHAVAPRVLAGVSTRDYCTTIDAVCEGYGVEKSSVSRHWKAASLAELRRLMERPLGELDLVAILIDGIEFHGFLLVVALGIDSGGRKHVLGLWPGATENTEVAKSLLADLVGTVALTTNGRQKFQQLFEAGEPIRAQMIDSLEPGEVETLVGLLKKVAASLNSQYVTTG
jgi:transposase-like protein